MSRVISKVLSPAMQLWLRSQVEEVETLEISIQGSDRQILKGHVSGVTLNSNQAIYQGLHLGEVQLKGENIRINIGQVLRGKPLQLLEAIRVSGAVAITNKNLQASISSVLLGEGFRGLLETLLEHQGISDTDAFLEKYQIDWQGAYLDNSYFILQGKLTDNGVTQPLTIKAKLTLIPPQTLQLSKVKIQGIPNLDSDNIERFSVDLGSDVSINSFQLDTDKLICEGELLIRP
ncbi:LmeA family phospholipid-binding protein [Crocosphaera sp. Alani8]|uniref:LmeA family phospholipid-binding protein n=1 Tax=Crocosphaera sp. Alani8 TaxID=3038952 RepID=UPI00313E7F0D